jgi:hypothetical protein
MSIDFAEDVYKLGVWEGGQRGDNKAWRARAPERATRMTARKRKNQEMARLLPLVLDLDGEVGWFLVEPSQKEPAAEREPQRAHPSAPACEVRR